VTHTSDVVRNEMIMTLCIFKPSFFTLQPKDIPLDAYQYFTEPIVYEERRRGKWKPPGKTELYDRVPT